MIDRRPVSLPLAFAAAAGGILVFSVMDAVMKGLVLAIGVYAAMFWRTLAGVVLSGGLYAAMRRRPPTRAAMRLHVVRGLVATLMALTFFWGLARVPMAQAIALAFVAPILSLLLAAVILKERVPRGSLVACALAAAGVATILAGQARAELGAEALAGTVAILVSAVAYAFNIILMRAQSQVASPAEVAFWQNLVVTACLSAAAPWLLTVPPAIHAPAIIGAAALATISMLLLSWAYAHGPASYLAPSEYTSFVWAAMLGWLVFGETLSLWTVGGAILIVGGSIAAARCAPVLEAAP